MFPLEHSSFEGQKTEKNMAWFEGDRTKYSHFIMRNLHRLLPSKRHKVCKDSVHQYLLSDNALGCCFLE